MNKLEELVCAKFRHWYDQAFCKDFIRRVLRLKATNCAEYAWLVCIEPCVHGDRVDTECIDRCAEEKKPYLCGEAVPAWLFETPPLISGVG